MLRVFKNLSKKDAAVFAAAIFLIIGQVWLDLKLPDYMSAITTLIETPGSEMSEVLSAGGKMLACAFGSMFMAALVAVMSSFIASDFSAATRKRIYDSVQGFSMAEMNRFSTPSLITRTTNDVTQVQMLIVMGMQAVIKAPIMAVMAILKISDKSWQWTMSTGVAVLALLVIILLTVALCLNKFRKIQKLTDDINRVTRENLTGLKVVRAYNADDYESKKFEEVNSELAGNNLFVGHTMAFMMPSIQAVMSGLSLAIYWVGAILINQAGMMERIDLFSDMIVFSSYAMQVVMAFMLLVVIFILYPRASVSAKRILEVTETAVSIRDGAGVHHTGQAKGEISFNNVSFRYPDADGDSIHDISFSAKQGETVAIIGATGSGKTTLVNLIPRLFDTTEGEVRIDGRNVRDYTQKQLHQKIAYVSQTPQLFAGSMMDNIAYGDRDEVKMEDIERASRIAEAEEFIAGKESGYESHVSQNGSNLSGGQRQRLSIARAIARDAEIIIFDDSFSALDYRTDRKVRDNLRRECADMTKIIVAQRIGTIRDADQILVLKDGEIAGKGTHEELIRT